MYGKVVLDGFIGAVVIGGGTPISETEYNEILNKIHNKPVAPDGYVYKLTEGLEWELVEYHPEEEPDEVDADRAMEILFGGED